MKIKIMMILTIVGLLVACGNSETHPQLPNINFEEVGMQGKAHFVFVESSPKVNKNSYRQISDYICGREQICIVMFWNTKDQTPRSLPMTDEQVNSKVAHYNLNKNTGMDRLSICAEDGC